MQTSSPSSWSSWATSLSAESPVDDTMAVYQWQFTRRRGTNQAREEDERKQPIQQPRDEGAAHATETTDDHKGAEGKNAADCKAVANQVRPTRTSTHTYTHTTKNASVRIPKTSTPPPPPSQRKKTILMCRLCKLCLTRNDIVITGNDIVSSHTDIVSDPQRRCVGPTRTILCRTRNDIGYDPQRYCVGPATILCRTRNDIVSDTQQYCVGPATILCQTRNDIVSCSWAHGLVGSVVGTRGLNKHIHTPICIFLCCMLFLF
jgi:hypothetical protein